MRPPQKAKLVLVGWYLMLCDPQLEMMPSFGCHIERSFDSAKECEEARGILPTREPEAKTEGLLGPVKAAELPSPGSEPEHKEVKGPAAQNKTEREPLCISTEDPRLKVNQQVGGSSSEYP